MKLFAKLMAVAVLLAGLTPLGRCEGDDAAVVNPLVDPAPVVGVRGGMAPGAADPVLPQNFNPGPVVNAAAVNPAGNPPAANPAAAGGGMGGNGQGNVWQTNQDLIKGLQLTKDGNLGIQNGTVTPAQYATQVGAYMSNLLQRYQQGDQSAGEALNAIMAPGGTWGPMGGAAVAQANATIPGKWAPAVAAGNAAADATALNKTVAGNQGESSILSRWFRRPPLFLNCRLRPTKATSTQRTPCWPCRIPTTRCFQVTRKRCWVTTDPGRLPRRLTAGCEFNSDFTDGWV
jgi:hypothetical protein